MSEAQFFGMLSVLSVIAGNTAPDPGFRRMWWLVSAIFGVVAVCFRVGLVLK